VPSLFDEVKSGLGALLDKVAGEEDGPIRELTPQQLREELTAREKLRSGSPSVTHPIARRADSSAAARKARASMAKEREARIRGARKKREAAARRAEEAAFEEAKRRAAEQARREAAAGARRSSQARPGGSSSRSSGSRGPSIGRDKAIAEHYKTLDLPYGADFPTVKTQFRKLLRKYHPDLHSGTAKQKAAAELTTKFNVAYNALEEHLKNK